MLQIVIIKMNIVGEFELVKLNKYIKIHIQKTKIVVSQLFQN